MDPIDRSGLRPPLTLFLCGDVMTGRGVDQILRHPSEPGLYEPYVRSATDYVQLAERATGAIQKPVNFDYVWGDAPAALEQAGPDARIINLETSVTTSGDAWPGKGIHYRMHPGNIPCLTALRPDCCVIANNHVMDWGRRGLAETLDVLHAAGIRTAGAGRDRDEAAAPACIDVGDKGRVLVFAYAMASSGVPQEWAAAENRSGVNFLDSLSEKAVGRIARMTGGVKQAGDVAVLSMHWGPNWGFRVAREERTFAHRVIDAANIDVVHGHSSHHVRGIEVYRGKPVIYGCGDFLNDYEGIGGNEKYRADLSLMYFPMLEFGTGALLQFTLIPMRIRHFRANRAPDEGVAWLLDTLNREGSVLGTRVVQEGADRLRLYWEG